MPTKSWVKDHHYISFWVTNEEAERLRIACEREDKSRSAVLREAVQILIASAEAKP